MAQLVTDPDILSKLNNDQPKKVTDPSVLAKLNGEADASAPRSFTESMSARAGEAMDQKPSGLASLIRTKALGFDPLTPLSKAAGVISSPVAAAGETLERKAGQAAGVNPQKLEKVARDTGDVTGELTGILPGGKVAKGAEAAGDAASAIGKSVSEGSKAIGEGYKARPQGVLDKITENYKQESGTHYKAMRESGVKIIPQKSQAIVSDIEKELMSSGKLNPHLHSETVKILSDMKKGSSKGFDVEDLDQYRRRFSEVISKSRLTGNQEDAFKAREAIEAIDSQFEGLKKGDVPKEAMDAVSNLKKGQEIWSKARKFETISDIIKKANGDPNRMKALFEQLANNKKKMRGFSPEEASMIKRASENTTAEGLLKMVGKLGITVGTGRAAATGNVLPVLETIGGTMIHGGGVPGFGLIATGTAAKYGQKLLAQAKAEKVLKAIESQKSSIPKINTGTSLESVIPQISQ